MKFAELKNKVYSCWENLSDFNSAIVQIEYFKPEVRKFGDLRCKSTWEQALATFWAKNVYDACLDAWSIPLLTFNFTPDHCFYEYRYQIFEAFLQLPDGVEIIKMGLEQLFDEPFTEKDRKEAYGFFELVSEQSRGIGFTIEPARRITAVK